MCVCLSHDTYQPFITYLLLSLECKLHQLFHSDTHHYILLKVNRPARYSTYQQRLRSNLTLLKNFDCQGPLKFRSTESSGCAQNSVRLAQNSVVLLVLVGASSSISITAGFCFFKLLSVCLVSWMVGDFFSFFFNSAFHPFAVRNFVSC